MSEAIYGIVGVILGVALSACLSELAAHRRDWAEARAASRLLERELRVVERSIYDWVAVKSAANPPRGDVLRFPAWKLYHSVAARTLPGVDWYVVSDCYMAFYEVRTRDEFVAALDDISVKRLREIAKSAADAADRLQTYQARSLLGTLVRRSR
jgi:hypothetical protein